MANPDEKPTRLERVTFLEPGGGEDEDPDHISLIEGKAALEIGNDVDDEDEEEKPQKPNLGDFLQFGWFTIGFMIVYEAVLIPQMGNMTIMSYGGYKPRVIGCGNTSFEGLTDQEACTRFESLRATGSCEPVVETPFESMNYEFGYYCSESMKIKQLMSVQMIGVMIGAPILGQFSDLYGRKRVIQVALAASCVLDFLLAHAPDPYTMTALHFINLVFTGGMSTTCHIYLMENVPKKHRVWIMLLLSYSPNYILFAGIAYLANNWRTLFLIDGFLCVPGFLLLTFLFFESPRWLIEKGRIKEAEHVFQVMEERNGTWCDDRSAQLTELINDEIDRQKNLSKKRKKYYLYHIFYTTEMCKWLLTFGFGLFWTAVLSYTLIFNMDQFSGNVYINTAIFGIMRVLVNASLGAVDFVFPSIGRKTIFLSVLGYVIAVNMLIFISKATGFEYPMATTIAQISATAMCSQMFAIVGVLSAELFPTAIRNQAASFKATMARLGGVFSPSVFVIQKFWVAAPFCLFFVTSLTHFILFAIFIPETKGQPMPDHMPPKDKRLFARKSRPAHLIERIDTTAANLIGE